uniref:NADH dehydrogenase subunit 4L n=1 Tax=Anopheles plumbeus TaxID=227531 RepID=UPI0030016FF0|nr:NADH dehydrogenase subunit 4L [Anopheles plumbeus]
MANMFLMFFLSLFMFLFGCIVFVSNRKHLLSTLLSLEYLVLSLFIFLFFFLNFMNYEAYFSMFFLTFCVCEGVLGLSILVSMIRTHGNDYFQSFSILQC